MGTSCSSQTVEAVEPASAPTLAHGEEWFTYSRRVTELVNGPMPKDIAMIVCAYALRPDDFHEAVMLAMRTIVGTDSISGDADWRIDMRCDDEGTYIKFYLSDPHKRVVDCKGYCPVRWRDVSRLEDKICETSFMRASAQYGREMAYVHPVTLRAAAKRVQLEYTYVAAHLFDMGPAPKCENGFSYAGYWSHCGRLEDRKLPE
jgi:hypothetical protein